MPRTVTATSSRQVRRLTRIAFFGPPVTVGQTENVLVDPHGWTAPEPAGTDCSGIDIAAWAPPVVLVLFELLVRLSRRVGLRRFEGR